MDLPLLSNFVQSAVDAAMAEYVAPKSLTLDLKDMLVGDDFKKDTLARGVLVVRIKRAFDFKEGDAGIGPLKNGSADPYVSVGWAKFGKPVWSTRVIYSEMEPWWEETAFVLVTPQELNVEERLRVQLWDSDRTTADDDLGRIEVDLKELMKKKESSGQMWDRVDGFRALKAGEEMPGKLEWSVGYYSKTRISDEQMGKQTEDPDIKTVAELKEKVYQESERKLREAKKDETRELEQQKAQDFKVSPPPAQVHFILISISRPKKTRWSAVRRHKKSTLLEYCPSRFTKSLASSLRRSTRIKQARTKKQQMRLSRATIFLLRTARSFSITRKSSVHARNQRTRSPSLMLVPRDSSEIGGTRKSTLASGIPEYTKTIHSLGSSIYQLRSYWRSEVRSTASSQSSAVSALDVCVSQSSSAPYNCRHREACWAGSMALLK